jgi:hypothetical protein
VDSLAGTLADLDPNDRMALYENRNAIYLSALKDRERLYGVLAEVLEEHFQRNRKDPTTALQVLALDAALCPRTGSEQTVLADFDYRADRMCSALSAMAMPQAEDCSAGECTLRIHHPGGVGDILKDADGGSWLRGVITEVMEASAPLPLHPVEIRTATQTRSFQ